MYIKIYIDYGLFEVLRGMHLSRMRTAHFGANLQENDRHV